MKIQTVFVACLLGLFAYGKVANAQTTLLSSPADFSGTEALIDFEDQTGPVVQVVDGVTFVQPQTLQAPPLRFSDLGLFPREFDPQGPNSIGSDFDFESGEFTDLLITFPSPINRVGFEMRTLPEDGIDVTINCVSNGVVVDSFTYLTPNDVSFKFYAFETAATFDQILLNAQGAGSGVWDFDNLRYELTTVTHSCVGFESPAEGLITVKKNRVIPLKAQLLDGNGFALTDADVVAPPVVEVGFTPAIGGVPVDVTEDIITAGQGTEGNQFGFSDGIWQFRLTTRNYTASGTYTARMVSGDSSEYIVTPTCEVQIIIF